MALRVNDGNDWKRFMVIVIEELGRDVSFEVKPEWIVPLHV